MHIADCIELYLAHDMHGAFTKQLEQTQEGQLSAGGTGSGRRPEPGTIWTHVKTRKNVHILDSDNVAVRFEHESGRQSSLEHDDFRKNYKQASSDAGRAFEYRQRNFR